jgi:hypothetical protein
MSEVTHKELEGPQMKKVRGSEQQITINQSVS